VLPAPHLLALASAVCMSLATILIHRGLQGASFWAGAWINVVVGAVVAWSVVLLLVPSEPFTWQAISYFGLSGLIGTTGGRLFRVLAIQKVGAPAAAAVNNLTPLLASGLAILLLGERVTLPIVAGTLIIVAGTILLSSSGRYVGFRARDLAYPFIAAFCFGVVQILRKLGLASAGPLLGATINITAALIATTTFAAVSGNLGSLRCSRRSLVYFIGGGIAENAGVFLLLLALGFGDVSVVIPLAGTAPLFVLAMAYLFPSDRSKLGWRIVSGVLLIVLGVALLSR
jgi:uncharacterized membrane protein